MSSMLVARAPRSRIRSAADTTIRSRVEVAIGRHYVIAHNSPAGGCEPRAGQRHERPPGERLAAAVADQVLVGPAAAVAVLGDAGRASRVRVVRVPPAHEMGEDWPQLAALLGR